MNCHILLIEDDDDIREIAIEVFEQHGFHAEGAPDGAQALRHLRAAAKLPDLIFLDLLMPVMDGAQFRAEQARDPKLAAIPVVVMSALTDGPTRALSLGSVEYLPKPLHSQDLIGLATKICGRRSQA